MIVWSAHGILSELDQVNNANSVIIFLINLGSVHLQVRVVEVVRVVRVVRVV